MELNLNLWLSFYVEKLTKAQISEIDKNLKLSSDEEAGDNIQISI